MKTTPPRRDLESPSDEPPGPPVRARAAADEEAESVQQLRGALEELRARQTEIERQNRAQRETQAELEHLVRRYSDLYDHLPLPYVTVSPDGQILAANQAALELLATEGSGLIGRFLGRSLDAYDAGRLTAHLEHCARTGEAGSLEIMLRLAEGKRIAVQLASRLSPNAPAGPRQIYVTITDISKLKNAQRILEEINREQETFNYSISHDLRAPLVTITNYARIVLTEHAERLDDEGRTMVQRMEAAALRMEQTLKHLLAYCTLARTEIALEPVSVDDVLREVLIEHRGVIEKTRAEIRAEGALLRLRGSRPMLSQVLANLLTNALKYTAPGDVPRVRISAEPRESTVVLRVADQGIGIDPKFHDRIFQIFERLHGYSHYPGSGVGLAIARRAMDRMNGRIWVESELGKGSCFCLELPRA